MGRVKKLLEPFKEADDFDVTYIKGIEENNWIVITEIIAPCHHFGSQCVHEDAGADENGEWSTPCGLVMNVTRMPVPEKCPNCEAKWSIDGGMCACVYQGLMRAAWTRSYHAFVGPDLKQCERCKKKVKTLYLDGLQKLCVVCKDEVSDLNGQLNSAMEKILGTNEAKEHRFYSPDLS